MNKKLLSIAILTILALAGQAQNNFKVDVKVTQGIEDNGYLIHLFDRSQTHRNYVGKITVTDKRTTFETHLDEPLVGDLTATFPDGSVCTHCVRFPFVPDEHAEVKVMNGTFYLTGSKFYKEWGNADELVENARKFQKQYETDNLIRNYLKDHASEEGCVLYYLKYNILPASQVMKVVSPAMAGGRFKHFFADYRTQDDDQVEVPQVSDIPVPDVNAITVPDVNAIPVPNVDVPGKFEPTPIQKMQAEQKLMVIKFNMEWIEDAYKSLEDEYSLYRMDMTFGQITQKNKELDKQWQEFFKMLKGFDIPGEEAAKIYAKTYEEILKFYTGQDKVFFELYKARHSLPKSAEKAQKVIGKLTEKYMKEASRIQVKK